MDASLAVWSSLLVAGLAGSLHCAGMCGPILFGFNESFRHTEGSAPRGLRGDFVWYHAGRLWTYAMLGLTAGLAGDRMRDFAATLGWQRAASLALSVAVLSSGLILAGLLPGVRLDGRSAACSGFFGRAWFGALARARGPVPRMLLGATMGLLPCGLVYAMLAVAAAMPSPLHAALGMLVFGIGTLPALSLVLVAGRLLPVGLRARGTRIAGLLLILAGCVMTARSALVSPAEERCGLQRTTSVP